MRQQSSRLVLSGVVLAFGCSGHPLQPTSSASKLAFTVQPASSAAGAVMATAVQVTVEDASGNAVPGYSGSVKLSLPFTTSYGDSLSGTTTVAAAGGVASFPNLRLNVGGAGYVLRASTTGLADATSTAFDVSCTTNCWTVGADMPTVRADLGVAVVNGVLYAIGGYKGADALKTVEAYDSATDSWVAKADMPTARCGFGVAVVNGVLYAIGGFAPYVGPMGTVEAYNPATDSWTTKASMPTPREFLAVGVVNGVIYAVGGYQLIAGGQMATDVVEAYDPVSDTWTGKHAMPTPRGMLGVGVVNGIVYAIGGSAPATVTEAYDPVANTWTTKAPMPTVRSGLGVAVVNGLIYAVGGVYSPGSTDGFMNAVQAYDPATNTWTGRAPLPNAGTELAVGVRNNTLYVVGGFAMFGPQTYGQVGTTEAYLP
jgi:N-acetylneuraminic acid mutarotase